MKLEAKQRLQSSATQDGLAYLKSIGVPSSWLRFPVENGQHQFMHVVERDNVKILSDILTEALGKPSLQRKGYKWKTVSLLLNPQNQWILLITKTPGTKL